MNVPLLYICLVLGIQSHWAFKPPVDHAPPAVKNAAWVRNEIDRFVLARLEAAGPAPQAEADRRTLVRRLTFDLTGLPPTPEELRAGATSTVRSQRVSLTPARCARQKQPAARCVISRGGGRVLV